MFTKRIAFALLILVGFVVAADARPLAKAIGFWRPRAILNAEPQTIVAGQTTTLKWESWNATSAQMNITEWWPYCNGYVVPTSGTMSVSPLTTTTYTITAFRRGRDMNHDGRADGPRRSFTATITVTVVPAK